MMENHFLRLNLILMENHIHAGYKCRNDISQPTTEFLEEGMENGF